MATIKKADGLTKDSVNHRKERSRYYENLR
jgi:hypothetical protein